MSVSKSTLQVATLEGCVKASVARVLVAANFKTGLGVVKKIWRTKADDNKKVNNYRHITTYQRSPLLIVVV